jgi:hypothetical protein
VQEGRITVRLSSENDPDEIAIGHFVVQDGVLTLTDANGKPLEGVKQEISAEGANPKSIAGRLTRQRWSETRGGFNRKLAYEPAWLGLAFGLARQLREQQSCDCFRW